MKSFKRILALILCLLMVMSFVACKSGKADESEKSASSTTSDTTENKGTGELTKLTAFGGVGIESYPAFDKFCQEKFGIKWESVMNGDGVMDAFLASGELPDMTFITTYEDFVAAAKGGMLLDLDQYKDLLPNVFGEEAYKAGMEKICEQGGGPLYGLPINVGPQVGLVVDPQIRWDVYEELGCPKVPDFDAYLDLLKDMVDHQRAKDSSVKTYGIGLWNDWDSGYAMRNVVHMYVVPHGYSDTTPSPLVEQLADGSMDPKSILDDDSMYKAGLKYLFKANQMGIVDPDSITQTHEGYTAKVAAGQYMSTPFAWYSYGDPTAEDYSGLASLWPEDAKIPTNPDMPVGNNGQYLVISSKCKNIEKILAYVDWYYSYDGLLTVYNGPEGECWNWVDGKRKFTDAFVEANNAGKAYELKDGGIYTFYSFCSYPGTTSGFPDKNGDGYIDAKMNPGIFGTNYNNLQKSWQKVYGEYASMEEAQKATGGKNLTTFSSLFGLVPTASDDIMEITTRIGEKVVETSWKMVFAKNEAEFESLWDELQSEASELGIDKVVEDATARWKEAKAAADKYGVEY